MSPKETEDYKKAGKIAKQAKEYAKSIIKKDMLLVEIAEKIEEKITELDGEVAFPVNLCINEIAAHYTPTLRDETKAMGLLKIDIGVHVNGFIADTAFSIDLTEKKENREVIKASENALSHAQKIINKDISLSRIGEEIQETIMKAGFSPIRNLSGHGLDRYEIHSGITIPNYKNNNEKIIGEGAFAIEPFATSGAGLIYEGEPSGIYHIIKENQVRDSFARKILEWIHKEKQTLPFSERELEKKFGARARLSLKLLEQAGVIKEYSQLMEKSRKPVSQAENTILIHNNKTEITT